MDYSKLKGRIIEKCGTLGNFAKKMGISDRSLTLKLSGVREFKHGEIKKACLILDLPLNDIPIYFFAA